MSREPFTYSRRHLLVIAVGWVIIGGLGGILGLINVVPDWRAAHGGGVTGALTLTEPLGCYRKEPPPRCAWVGDFRSDDGKTVRRHMYLAGRLPPGAQVGDTVPARDTGSQADVYPLIGSKSWKETAGFTAIAFGVCLLGLLAIDPWFWLRKRPHTSAGVGAQ